MNVTQARRDLNAVTTVLPNAVSSHMTFYRTRCKAGYDGALSYETEGWEEPAQSQQMIEASLAWTKNLLNELKIKFD